MPHIVFFDHADMICGAAAYYFNARNPFEVFLGDMFKAEINLPVMNSWADGLHDSIGLLHDLLYHEMGITAFFRSVNIPVDMFNLVLDTFAVAVHDGHSVLSENCKLPFAETENITGMLKERRNIGCYHILVLTEPDDQRPVLTDCHYLPWIIRKEDAEGIRTLELHLSTAHCGNRVTAVIIIDKLGNDLGIRIAREGVAVRFEKSTELQIIFYYAVVYYCDLAAVSTVRMRIIIRRPSMGRPTGMTDTDGEFSVTGRI